jgi:surface protein
VMFSSATAFNNGGNSSWAGWSSATKLANTNGMFRFTGAFNQPVSEINMANVVDAGAMFSQANVFNNGGSNSINNWNVSNITNMSSMFQLTPAFNQPLNNWNTSKVTDMTNMFADANTFNRDLGGWNVANVTSHQAMFQRATLFNNGGNTLASWNMANTLSTRFMFNGSSSLNQPMPRWNLSNVADINADSMFANATSFNQDLSGWCVPQLTTQPASFATNTPAWTLAKPVWGTCPP